jgi:hypothetical protein
MISSEASPETHEVAATGTTSNASVEHGNGKFILTKFEESVACLDQALRVYLSTHRASRELKRSPELNV